MSKPKTDVSVTIDELKSESSNVVRKSRNRQPLSEETKAKIRERAKARSAEISARAKERWADPVFRERMKEADKKGWEGRDDRRELVSSRVSAFRKGRPLSEEHKASIKAGMALRSDEDRYHSPETRAKISEANKGRRYTPEQLAIFKAAAQRREADRSLERELARTSRQLELQKLWHYCECCEECREIVKDPNLQYARGHSPESQKKLGTYRPYLYEGQKGDIPMRGTWEVLYAHYLDARGIDWEYEKRTFAMTGCAYKSYTPDFYLPAFDKFVEVKGYYRSANQQLMRAFHVQYPHIKLRLVRLAGMEKIRKFLGLPPEKQH